MLYHSPILIWPLSQVRKDKIHPIMSTWACRRCALPTANQRPPLGRCAPCAEICLSIFKWRSHNQFVDQGFPTNILVNLASSNALNGCRRTKQRTRWATSLARNLWVIWRNTSLYSTSSRHRKHKKKKQGLPPDPLRPVCPRSCQNNPFRRDSTLHKWDNPTARNPYM